MSIDYDLHGIVGIRLEGADASDAAAVDRQLGPIRRPLARDPDLVIRFVDRGHLARTMLIGHNSGLAGDDFVVLRGKHKVPVRVTLPLDELGRIGCEITIERGAPAVPYLVACVNLLALARGALPLHASAFVHENRGVLVTGWSKGGKTEALLAFVTRGAEYVGDEWVYVLPDGRRMVGIPEPIRVWDWELAQLPELGRRIGRGARARVRSVQLARRVIRSGRLAAILDRQLAVDVPPGLLFGVPPRSEPARIDAVCFIGSWTDERIERRPIRPDEIASRMAWSLRYEQLPLWSLYQEHRYALPRRRSELIESAADIQERRLNDLLRDQRCFSVLHPYPVDLRQLHDVIVEGIRST